MIYLIDFENVHEDGFSALGRLGEKDAVYCFFTKNVAKISMSALAGIRSGQLHFVEAETGKQSLDLVLVSYLGYLIGTKPEEKGYEIVSNDNGFLKSADFWNMQGMDLHVRVRKTGTAGKRVKVEAKAAPAEDTGTAPSAPAQPAQTGSSRQRRRGGQRGKLRANTPVEEQKKPEAVQAPETAKQPPVQATVPAAVETEQAKQQPVEKLETKDTTLTAAQQKEILVEKAEQKNEEPAAKPQVKPVASAAQEGKEKTSEAPVVNTPETQKAPEASDEKPATMPETKPAEKEPGTKAKMEAGSSTGKTGEKRTRASKQTRNEKAKARKEKSAEQKAEEKAPEQKNDIEVPAATPDGQNAPLLEALAKAGIEKETANFLAAQVAKFAEEKNFKQLIYRALVKQYGQKAGTAIYNTAKKVQV